MKQILLTFGLLLLLSCEHTPGDRNLNRFTLNKGSYQIYIIESCEYVKVGQTIAHKGNCKNHPRTTYINE